MNRYFRTILFVGLLIVTPAGVIAQQADQSRTKLPPTRVKEIEAAIAKDMAQRKIPALTVAIAVDNKLSFSKAFGLADLEHKVRCRTVTVFRTASIAKPMTAIAVMQLSERRMLDLDAPIQKYCPALPQKRWPVTARQLLAHLGGIRHYKSGVEAAGTQHFFNLKSTLRLFKDDRLKHEPGTKFLYTTYGYTLLGRAIETVTGMTYEKYMQEHVFGPAGMKHTRIDHVRLIIPDRARGYTRLRQKVYDLLPTGEKSRLKVGEVYNATLHDTSMKVPGGGLLSTAEDCAVRLRRQ